MNHLGDVTKINGAEIAPVDVIIGGSPCQDLSVAGKRAGLAGARSGLFMEQIRVVKEMRNATNGNRPRFMVWENVPGAFSSNRGEDFAAVLEETIRVVEPEAPCVDVPERGWPTWGQYRDVGGRWSVAWRVLDAQYWGVPQRRRRIALVADFGGCAAGEILFNRKGVPRDSEPRSETREGAAAGAEGGAGETVWCLQGNGIDRAEPLTMRYRSFGDYEPSEHASTLKDRNTADNSDVVCKTRTFTNPSYGGYREADIAGTCAQRDYKSARDLVLRKYVRRLTPLECERLQAFPDGWTDIGDWTDSKGKTRKTSDAARYKALGNSIALPPWKWVLKRLCAEYERDATMGSLFDGIGGFPLIWEQLNGIGSCLWASEIEEFCIAVTKRRFGG